MTIKDFQKHIKEIYHPLDILLTTLKLTEEIGEVAEAVLRIEKKGLTNENKKMLSHELYDVLHFMGQLANHYGIDLEESLIEKDLINSKRYNERRTLK
jgi:NTP pyrophosphatase (non-canonical NTP hydrolase)